LSLNRDANQILGLDGARALSVAAVLLYHAGFGWMGGGFLGVELFFVISGYLITHLLLREERIELGRFWIRRLRRLLPALLVVILAVEALGVFWMGGAASQFRGDLLASLFYLENWYQIRSGSSYFADAGHPLLRHLWSLSVEAQFYLVWPFLVLAGRRVLKRRWMMVSGLALMALGSALLMALRVDPANPSSVKALESLNRVYLGTDTRASGLLVGALLAVLPRPDESLRRAWVLDVAALGALVGLGAFCCLAETDGIFLYRGGFLCVDLLMALVIAALIVPGTRVLRALLGWAPLEALGRRSYGIYLWHWPIFRVVAPGLQGGQGFALRVGLTLLLSEISYRWVETPIRQGVLGRWWSSHPGIGPWRRRLVLASGMGLLTASLAGAAVLIRRPAYIDEVQASLKASAAALDGGTPVSTPALPPPGSVATVPVRLPLPPPDPVLEAVPLEGLSVTAIGDSVMKGAALSLKAAGEARLGEGQLTINAEECRSFARALGVVQTYRQQERLGEVVVIHLGANNSNLDSRNFAHLMEALSDRRSVWFLTAKSDKAEAVEAVNRSLQAMVARYPNAHLYDWRSASEAHPELFYSDQTHLRPEGSRFYAREIFARIASDVLRSQPPKQARQATPERPADAKAAPAEAN